MPPVRLTVAVVALAVLLPGTAAQAATSKSKTRYYVSLGDSLAVGWKPGADGKGRETKRAYTDLISRHLRKRHRTLRHVRLGCPGETTTSFMKGGKCRYRGGSALKPRGRSQLQAATRFIRAHRRQVVEVTIDIGANDVAGCAREGRVDGACLANGIKSLERNLDLIAGDLRDAGTPKMDMTVMTYYDPFWQFWLLGPEGQQTAEQSVGLAKDVNLKIATAFGAKRFRLARVFEAFLSEDRTLVAFFGQQVPRAVERICVLTYMCQAPPVGPDYHVNRAGAEVIAKAFRQAL